MRNLRLLYAHQQAVAADAASSSATAAERLLQSSQLVCDQNHAHIVYVAAADRIWRLDTLNSNSTILYQLRDNNASASAHSPAAPAGDVIVDVQHLGLSNEMCFATAAGDVRVFSIDDALRSPLAGVSVPVETVGFCAGGCRRMRWSPDQEVVAFVTGAGVLIVMDTLYTPVAESVLDEASFGDGAFVNVGWGAKETQFHGTAGKAARFRKADDDATPSTPATGEPTDAAAAPVEIVWRGDAAYFAVSFVGAASVGVRMFKVFDKEGTLQFTAEPTAGLGGCIAWRPSGTWLAIPQRLASDRYVIALFEKNGLKHREIVLPFGVAAEHVRRLEWSADADVLAVETWDTQHERSRLHLLTMCNYHWYRKQTLDFAAAVVHCAWDPVGARAAGDAEPKRLHVLTADGRYVHYRWTSEVSASRTFGGDDAAAVAVIDGTRVLVTGFRAAVVPPPMCSAEVTLGRPVNWVDWVAFPADAEHANRFAAVDAENVVHVFRCRSEAERLTEVHACGAYRLPAPVAAGAGAFPLCVTHWLYLTEERVVYATASERRRTGAFTTTTTTRLHLGGLRSADGTDVELLGTCTVRGQCHRVVAVNRNVLLVATSDGLYRIAVGEFTGSAVEDTETDPFMSSSIRTYPDAVEHLLVADGGAHVFALKPKHFLYHNDRLLPHSMHVTSMHLAERYLLYTTLDRLHFVRLSDGAGVAERRSERGSRLVHSVPGAARTILQMPRGNLEAIQPRVLSLCIVGQLLSDGEYHRAFDEMRKQRINLNLLYDHDADQFGARVERFVLSVRQAHWLNLFLSDLTEADCTATLYSSNYPQRLVAAAAATNDPDGNGATTEGKVQRVCRLVREAIESQQLSGELLLPILTSYVKQKQLERALAIVWELKQREDGAGEAETGAVNAAEALKYLLYLVSVNELYNVALGTYDFGLVRFVARRSQKDPKEYLPQLSALQQIGDVNYRRFRIDVQLKRYERALEHIVACGAQRSDECVELVTKHRLYTQALRAFRAAAPDADVTVCRQRVEHAFAEHLRETGKFRDASLMYERCGAYGEALLQARHILDWQKCVELAHRAGHSEAQIAQMIASLIPALVENGNHLHAAQLVLKYQPNVQHAVSILCDGKLYTQALFEARMGDVSLIASLVRPHLETHAATLIAILDADRDQFVAHRARLAIVRREREAARRAGCAGTDPHSAADGDANVNDADADAYSDTSSMRSTSSSRYSGASTASSRAGTGKTHQSSKNRRKHERKLLSLKPGNAFEDIALVDALHAAAHKAFDQQATVRSVCRALIEQRLDALGRSVQMALRGLLGAVTTALEEIWIAEMRVTGVVDGMDGAGGVVLTAPNGRLDYAQVQREQHYAMIKPHQRYKPELKAIDWEFDVLG